MKNACLLCRLFIVVMRHAARHETAVNEQQRTSTFSRTYANIVRSDFVQGKTDKLSVRGVSTQTEFGRAQRLTEDTNQTLN